MFWLVLAALLIAGLVAAAVEARSLLPGMLFSAALFLLLGRPFTTPELDGGEDLAVVWLLLGYVVAFVIGIAVLGVAMIWNTFEMFRREGRRPAAVVTGLVGSGLLAYIVLALLAVRENSFGLAAWLLLLGLPLGYLGYLFVSFLSWSFLYGRVTRRFGRPVDAVIVLGAGLLGGHRVSPLLAARLEEGRRVLEASRSAGRDTVLVLSGGKGDDEDLPEAEAMALHLESLGVPGSLMRLEDRSTTTQENLRFSAALLEQLGITGRVAVATNNYHAFRAATLMRKARLAGYSVGAPTAHYYWPSATMREFFAMLRDHLWLNLVAALILSLPVIFFTAAWILSMTSRG